MRGFGDLTDDTPQDSLSDIAAQQNTADILSLNPLSSSPANVSSGSPPTTGGGSSIWSDLGSVASSFVKGFVTKPSASASVRGPAPSSGGSNTMLLVGGLAVVGVLGFLLLRRR